MNQHLSRSRKNPMMLRSTVSFILTGLLWNSALALEKQLNFSTFYDTNPLESTDDRDPTPGLKAKGLIRFEKEAASTQIYGSLLGQGFLEPALFLDSKLLMNGELGGYHQFASGYRLHAGLISFQKLYLNDLQRSGRTTMTISTKRFRSPGPQIEVGLRWTDSYIDYGTLFHYTSGRFFLKLTKQLRSSFLAEALMQTGRTDYSDYLAKKLTPRHNVVNGVVYQVDRSHILGLHVKHLGKMIWGISMNYEDIGSNSVIGKAQIWTGKAYASGRFTDEMFYHIMIHLVDKNYRYPELLDTSPFRDPEENIQNQVHLQLERLVQPGQVLYAQYSYIKNETVINYYFYTKHLFEVGLKLTL